MDRLWDGVFYNIGLNTVIFHDDTLRRWDTEIIDRVVEQVYTNTGIHRILKGLN